MGVFLTEEEKQRRYNDRYERYEKEMVELIKSNPNIVLVSDLIVEYPGLGMSQFYNLKLEKSENIKNALWYNRTKIKSAVKRIWLTGNNPTLSLAAYKLIADDDELERLNQNNVKLSGGFSVSNESYENLANILEQNGKNESNH